MLEGVKRESSPYARTRGFCDTAYRNPKNKMENLTFKSKDLHYWIQVARVMSWTQTCFGLGYMLGMEF